MSPHPELVQEYADKYCMAVPGKEYIVYLRWGGTVKVDLQPSSPSETFEYYFFDPGTGKATSSKTINGGRLQFFSSPGGYPGVLNFKDWVLHVKKK